MKHLHLTLGYLKEQRAKLDTSIALLETLLGASNGHGGTFKTAADALALHEQQQATTTPRRRPGPPRSPGTYARTKAQRAAKAQTLVEILREAGPGGLAIRDLAQAAKARGIAGLTGINGLVKNGTLKRTGKVKGQFRYSVMER